MSRLPQSSPAEIRPYRPGAACIEVGENDLLPSRRGHRRLSAEVHSAKDDVLCIWFRRRFWRPCSCHRCRRRETDDLIALVVGCRGGCRRAECARAAAMRASIGVSGSCEVVFEAAGLAAASRGETADTVVDNRIHCNPAFSSASPFGSADGDVESSVFLSARASDAPFSGRT